MIAPDVTMTARLRQTSAKTVPIAVRGSTVSSSSLGIESALMAKEKAPPRRDQLRRSARLIFLGQQGATGWVAG